MQKHVDIFISRLGKEIDYPPKGVINAVQWFTYLTTDIIGDLAFGESFGGLEKNEMHPFLDNLFSNLKAFSLFRELSRYPRLLAYGIMVFMIPRQQTAQQTDGFAFGAEKAQKRMARGTDRPDFMSYILQHNNRQQ